MSELWYVILVGLYDFKTSFKNLFCFIVFDITLNKFNKFIIF